MVLFSEINMTKISDAVDTKVFQCRIFRLPEEGGNVICQSKSIIWDTVVFLLKRTGSCCCLIIAMGTSRF